MLGRTAAVHGAAAPSTRSGTPAAGRTSLEESTARAGEAEAAVEGVDEVQLVVRDVLGEDGAGRPEPGRETSGAIACLDRDPHKLIQVGGPKVMLGKAMMTGDVAQISFPTKGVYKFTTKTLEMPGMAEVETIGPDHNLQLTVDVA